MSSLLQKIVNKAHDLSPEERAELVHDLIISLDEGKDIGAKEAWDTEIEKRVAEIKSGKAKGRAAEDIIAQIRAKYS